MILCCFSLVRSSIYEDEITLFGDVVVKSPDKARGHNNLGNALKIAKRVPEAQIQFEAALALAPDYPDALNNLSTVYNNSGRKREAVELLVHALSVDPGHVQARYNLAMYYYENGMQKDADREYRIIIDISPLSKEGIFSQSMLRLIGRSGTR